MLRRKAGIYRYPANPNRLRRNSPAFQLPGHGFMRNGIGADFRFDPDRFRFEIRDDVHNARRCQILAGGNDGQFACPDLTTNNQIRPKARDKVKNPKASVTPCPHRNCLLGFSRRPRLEKPAPQARHKANRHPIRPNIKSAKEETAILEGINDPYVEVRLSTREFRANGLSRPDVAGTE